MRHFFCSLLLALASAAAAAQEPSHLLLSGNIVTPAGVIPHGWLDIRNGHILHVERQKPEIPGARELATDDLIFPGFIDLHNHPEFNLFPRWSPRRNFPNRYAWRDWDVYLRQMEDKWRALPVENFCDMDEYVEVKALIGGTTSFIGIGSAKATPPDCIRGLVRNLDHATGFYGDTVDHERIANSIGILPRDMDAQLAARYAQQIRDGQLDLLAIHIAEGLPTDEESAQELDLLDAHGLLTAHTALVHSVGLSESQLARVHRAGASIVWSPRSNFELYGVTANVDAAFRQGVTISLAPDWSPSGSDNMWEEIQYAGAVSREKLSGLFSARQLVEMASSVPARAARIDDKVGQLAPGMLADLFLVKASAAANPYEAILANRITAIDLVMIGGTPIYGDPSLLTSLGIAPEPLEICGASKGLNPAALPSGPFAQVKQRLQARMKAVGSELGPLDSCPSR